MKKVKIIVTPNSKNALRIMSHLKQRKSELKKLIDVKADLIISSQHTTYGK